MSENFLILSIITFVFLFVLLLVDLIVQRTIKKQHEESELANHPFQNMKGYENVRCHKGNSDSKTGWIIVANSHALDKGQIVDISGVKYIITKQKSKPNLEVRRLNKFDLFCFAVKRFFKGLLK